ncbi:unnamed protein product [Periconia digitata]|uniref:Uncharacterized protein n=1 Tax=Periconia digitata TaxID=1303443 RepID=A0A9W4UJP3_9PLEO|nr:unnamed protein product [Periconia digitata]
MCKVDFDIAVIEVLELGLETRSNRDVDIVLFLYRQRQDSGAWNSWMLECGGLALLSSLGSVFGCSAHYSEELK